MADGSLACTQFNERNERELAAWQKSQPPVLYAYPREGLVLGAPWGSLLRRSVRSSGISRSGGGLGSALEISGNREPTRLSLSPEAVIQFGHCCDAGYFTLQVRYDHFLGGNDRDLIGGSLGFVYF